MIIDTRFNDYFSKKEINDIVNIAIITHKDYIVISTEKHYIELKIENDKLKIYCDEHSNKTVKEISKKELLEICNVESPLEIINLTIDE